MAKEIIDWCLEPLKRQKRVRTIAAMKNEIKRRVDGPSITGKNGSEETEEVDETDPEFKAWLAFSTLIHLFDGKEFDLPLIAKVQLRYFSSPALLRKELKSARTAGRLARNYIREVKKLC
jgi:hypothetical protein